jgi:GNAT superfamily N-acetyltransferase
MEAITIEHNGFVITTDKSLLKPEEVHQWLSTTSYWCKGVPYEVVKTSFDHSYCIGALKDGKQVGYARLVTDYAVFAYLADVYVVEEHRGMGISKKMMELLMNQEWVKGMRRVMLATKDAHALYTQFGFTAPADPDRLMEIVRPAAYVG